MQPVIGQSFAALLSRYRIRKGWTQERLAEFAGLSARSVSDQERGITTMPSRTTIESYIRALELTPEEAAQLRAVVPRRPAPQQIRAIRSETVVSGSDDRRFTYWETPRFASAPLRETVGRNGRYGILALDDGLMLYVAPRLSPLKPTALQFVVEASEDVPNELQNPVPNALNVFLQHNRYRPDVRNYLHEKAAAGASGRYQTKLGLCRIDYPVGIVGQALTLHVCPVSFWEIQEFNRSMLLSRAGSRLLGLRNKCRDSIFAADLGFDLPFPSALYVEYCIITSDDKLVVVAKRHGLSALASSGFRHTCTVEEGIVWHRDLKNGRIDLADVAINGARRELAIQSNEIAQVDFFGVALEHTHLNSAVLGTLRLHTSAEELVDRIEESDDFVDRDYHFIHIESVWHELFDPATNIKTTWHPTARLRAYLATQRGHLRTRDPSNEL